MFFLVAASASAAVPTATVDVRELLSMPADNRLQMAKGLDDSALSKLVVIANSENESLENRWKSVSLYANLKKESALPLLSQWSRSSLWYMRNASLMAMQTVSPEKAHEVALNLLRDKALVVRSAAVGVLSQSLSAQDRQTLWSEFKAEYNFHRNQSLWIRGQILEALAQAPQKNEKQNFIVALEDKDNRVSAQAILALEKITKLKMGEQALGKKSIKSEDLDKKRALWIQWARNQDDAGSL